MGEAAETESSILPVPVAVLSPSGGVMLIA